MISAVGFELVAIWPKLQELALGFDMTGEYAADNDEARATITDAINLCKRIGWTDLANQASRLLKRALAGERGEVMKALADDLLAGFAEKVQGLHIAIVEERDAELFANAAKHLGGSLAGTLSVSEEELNLAGRALALGLSTAAVSHAMRSVEASLHVLANEMGVTFPGASVELQDWLNLTEKIKSEIEKWEKRPRSDEKAKKLQALAELMVSADCFRLAWRNHVQHARERYETEQARPVLTHVGLYLKRLSEAI